VVVGIVTVTVPELLVFAARPGTRRLPVSRMSPALFAPSSDR
jgi:hypothetical protein